MSREEQVTELKAKVDAILKEYTAEYQALASRSEKLHDEQKALEKEYKTLDAKTGLSILFEKIAKLKEIE